LSFECSQPFSFRSRRCPAISLASVLWQSPASSLISTYGFPKIIGKDSALLTRSWVAFHLAPYRREGLAFKVALP